ASVASSAAIRSMSSRPLGSSDTNGSAARCPTRERLTYSTSTSKIAQGDEIIYGQRDVEAVAPNGLLGRKSRQFEIGVIVEAKFRIAAPDGRHRNVTRAQLHQLLDRRPVVGPRRKPGNAPHR